MRTPEERFWIKTEQVNDCLIWTASITWNGYGLFWFQDKLHLAHRVAWYFQYGVFPNDQLDHLCRVRACVEVMHLEDVTAKENVYRSDLTNKEYCKKGHYLPDVGRYPKSRGFGECRECSRLRHSTGRV